MCFIALPVPPFVSTAAQPLPEPAVTYRVVHVSPDDALNVRAQPGVGNPVVGTLAHDATGVAVTGVGQPVGSRTWWEVIHPGAERDRGWVHARFLEAEEVAPATRFPLQCAGTEPFWLLAIAEGEAAFDLVGGTAATWRASPWIQAAGFVSGYRFAVRLDRSSPPATGWVTVSRATGSCSDAMSERLHPYDMTLITPDEEVFSGCCARAP